jgi:glycolate oxidase iron-sulfur subunit
MALHEGDGASAAAMRRRNLQAFTSCDAVLTLASGCAAVLKEYPDAPAFTAKIHDISAFLLAHPWPRSVQAQALSGKALLHSPCTLRNVLKSEQAVSSLLQRIPQLELIEPPKSIHCCGAAGTYMLEHPAMAQALRGDILDFAAAVKPDYLLTSNVGCAMHLRAGLKQRGLDNVRVLHPVVLLEQELAVLR